MLCRLVERENTRADEGSSPPPATACTGSRAKPRLRRPRASSRDAHCSWNPDCGSRTIHTGSFDPNVARIIRVDEFDENPPGFCSALAESDEDVPDIKGATPSPSAESRRNLRRPMRRNGYMVGLLMKVSGARYQV